MRDALEAPAAAPTEGVRDRIMHTDTSYSLGFGKPTSTFVFGSSGKAFGWPGAGGSFGFADTDTGTGYGYVPGNSRCAKLCSAASSVPELNAE